MMALAPNSTMPRPKMYDEAVKLFAAQTLAARIVESWDHDGTVEDWIDPLAKCIRRACDGYELARDLERYHYISPDSELVEILDEAGWLLGEAHEDALRKWVKITGYSPRYALGDRVVWHGRVGKINGVQADKAEYYFAPDDDAEKYARGGGYVLCDDDLEPAIAAATGTAKTPQAVECEASQSGGKAASPKDPLQPPSSTLDMD